SHFQGGNDEVGVDAFAHAPAHYRASKDVYGHGEVQPAFQRPVLRYVSHPQLVGATGSELAQHQVIENRMKFLRSAWAAAAPPVTALQPKLTHEALNTLTGAAHSVLESYFGVNPWTAVSTVAPLVSFLDQFTEAFIFNRPLRRPSVSPGVVAAP